MSRVSQCKNPLRNNPEDVVRRTCGKNHTSIWCLFLLERKIIGSGTRWWHTHTHNGYIGTHWIKNKPGVCVEFEPLRTTHKKTTTLGLRRSRAQKRGPWLHWPNWFSPLGSWIMFFFGRKSSQIYELKSGWSPRNELNGDEKQHWDSGAVLGYLKSPSKKHWGTMNRATTGFSPPTV